MTDQSSVQQRGDDIVVTHFLHAVRLELGGLARAVLDLCGALSERGVRIRLVSYDMSAAPEQWRNDPSAPQLVQVAATGRLRRRQAEQAIFADADLVHFHVPWQMQNMQFIRTALRRDVPCVMTLHGMFDRWPMKQKALKKRLFLSLISRRLLRQIDINVSSEQERLEAGQWIPGARMHVIPLVFDLEPFRELPGPAAAEREFNLAGDPRPRLLFLSRVHPQKGVDLLLDAAAELRDRGADFRLLIAGPAARGYEQKLRRRCAELRLIDRVQFLGSVTGPLKVSLYQAADVFVLPTFQESFGLVLPEAMASRTPVVTTREVKIHKEIEAAGGIMAELDPIAFADAIEPLLTDAEDRNRRGESGRTWVLEHLEPAHVADQFIDMYRHLLADRSR